MIVNAEERNDFLESTSIFINENATTKLSDNNYNTYVTLNTGDAITIENTEIFNYVYIIYYLESMTGTINYSDTSTKVGENQFLHECIKLDEETNKITINYDDTVRIKEIFLFNETLPNWVQTWNKPLDNADILLFSTHSDDEHLFFAGLIPSMIASGKNIQVVYLTHHNDNPKRLDEQLNGLWAVGLRNYPVLGVFPDAYSESLNGAINNLAYAGFSIDDVINFQIEIIKRFKPLVVVNHDEAGEYSHGQHILNTHALKETLNLLEYEYKPEKVYLHLYAENPITMNYDIPLEYYNGMTAYEVSKLGYAEHDSQQYTWFTDWLKGKNNEYTKATDIKTYSPTKFGLYYSKNGNYETLDNDLFYDVEITSNEETIEDNQVNEPVKEEIEEPTNNEIDYKIPIIIVSSLIGIALIIILVKVFKK